MFVALYIALDLPSLAAGILIAVTLGLLNLRLMRTAIDQSPGNVVTVIMFALITYLCVRSGGINSPAVGWYVAIPVLCTMITGFPEWGHWIGSDPRDDCPSYLSSSFPIGQSRCTWT